MKTTDRVNKGFDGVGKKVQKYDMYIDKWSRTHGINPNLVRAIISVESGGDPNAESSAGAVGLMQPLSTSSGKTKVGNFEKQIKNAPEELRNKPPTDPEANIYVGTKMLAFNMNKVKKDFGEINLKRAEEGKSMYMLTPSIIADYAMIYYHRGAFGKADLKAEKGGLPHILRNIENTGDFHPASWEVRPRSGSSYIYKSRLYQRKYSNLQRERARAAVAAGNRLRESIHKAILKVLKEG